MSYTYKRTITIDHTKVPNTDQANFPVLVSWSDNSLKTMANGGHITSSSGYDLIFGDPNQNKYDHEIEKYDGVNGVIVMWLRVPTVSHTVDTVFYMYYSDAGVTTSQENVHGVWNTNFKGVWHMNNATGVTVADSTSNSNNGVPTNNPVQQSGQIDGSLGFDGNSTVISVSDATSLKPTAITVRAWVNPTAFSSYQTVLMKTTNNNWNDGYGLAHYSSSDINFFINNYTNAVSSTLATGVWSRVVGTYDGATMRLYINGIQVASSSYSSAIAHSNQPLLIGNGAGGSYYWNGGIDNPSISSGADSPDWIATEYNNQSSPSIFYTIGSEQAIVSISSGSGYGLGIYGAGLYGYGALPDGSSVWINNSSVFVEAGSLIFDQTIGRRSSASFTIRSDNNTHFRDYQQVQIFDQNNNLVFSGYVTLPKESPPGFQPTLEHTIQCCDQHYLADKRRVTVAFTNKTPGYMAYWIWKNILAAEGVTIGHIEDGPVPSPFLYPSPTLYPGVGVGPVPSVIFNYAKASDALDALAKKASEAGIPYYWMIDFNKQFWFDPYTAIVNTTIVDGTQVDDGIASGSQPTCTRANTLYRNTQYAIGGYVQTLSQTATRIGDNNTTTWPMDYDLSNIAPTISVNSTPKNVGIKGVDTGKDFYYQQGGPDIVQDSSGTKLTSSDTLHVTYIGQYPSVFSDQDTAQVALRAQLEGNSGIVEDVVEDNTITTAAQGLSVVGQLITLYCKDAMILTFSTLQTGFAQGQLITVTFEQFDLYSAQFLIEDVSASDQADGYNIWYSITAIQGPADQNWVYFFQKMLGQQPTSGNINVGVSTALTILGSFSATLSVTATLTTNVYTLPVPSPTLYPNSTLYPG